MAKYEDKQGEAEKWQKDLTKSVDDAKKNAQQ